MMFRFCDLICFFFNVYFLCFTRYQRQQRKEGLLPNMPETLTLSPSRIRCHHPKCPKMNRKLSNINEQLITVMVPLNSSSTINLNTSMHNITVAGSSPIHLPADIKWDVYQTGIL